MIRRMSAGPPSPEPAPAAPDPGDQGAHHREGAEGRALHDGTPVTLIHVVRHGEVHNPERILYGRLPGYHLSELGQQMAQAAAEHLADRRITYVVSSPLERARETAAPIARAHGLEVASDEHLVPGRGSQPCAGPGPGSQRAGGRGLAVGVVGIAHRAVGPRPHLGVLDGPDQHEVGPGQHRQRRQQRLPHAAIGGQAVPPDVEAHGTFPRR